MNPFFNSVSFYANEKLFVPVTNVTSKLIPKLKLHWDYVISAFVLLHSIRGFSDWSSKNVGRFYSETFRHIESVDSITWWEQIRNRFFFAKNLTFENFLSALKRKGRRQASKRERIRKTLTDIYFEIHLKLTLSLSLNKQYTRESVQWKSHFPNAITFVCAIQTETSNGCWKRNIWPQGCRY